MWNWIKEQWKRSPMYVNQRIALALESIAASIKELVEAQKMPGGTVVTPKEEKQFKSELDKVSSGLEKVTQTRGV